MKKKSLNLKKRLFSITLLLGLSVALSACLPEGRVPGGAGGTGSEGESTLLATNLEAVAVESLILEAGNHYEQVYVAGQLEAQDAYNVLPYIGGVVEEIMVQVGDVVNAGEVLYTLDTGDMEVSKTDTLTALNRSKEQAYNSLLLSRNDLTSSQTSLDNAQKNYEDNLRLLEGGFITQVAMDGYENALENARIGYDRAVINLENAQYAYDGAVDTYNDSARDFEANLADMTVTSPIDGTVTRIDVQVDVTNNMNAGITVTGTGNILVTGSIIESYINEVATGQEALIEVKNSQEIIKGQVTSVAASSANSYYPIEISLDTSSDTLRPGMFAGITINTQLAKDIITVPKTAILGTGSTKYVFVDLEGMAEKTLVSLGRDFGGLVEITEGLAVGDELIVEGQVYLENGTPLIVNNEVGLE